jgi:hypothetical protein
MPVVRVSDRTYRRIQAYKGKPDEILTAALDALDAKNMSFAPIQKKALPEDFYRNPLIEVIKRLGGAAETSTIHDVMEKMFSPILNEVDLEKVSSGQERWWNKVCWLRDRLVKEGILDGSVHGVWSIKEPQ